MKLENNTYVYILASKGIRWESKLIQWYQFGFPYTHVAYITNYGMENFCKNNPEVIEAWFPTVRKGLFSEAHTPGTEFTVFRLKVTHEQKSIIEQFLHAQIGKPYDIIGLLAFLSRIKVLAKNDFWFCSELLFTAFLRAGVQLLKYTEPQEVTPALLLKSPLLEEVYSSKLPGKQQKSRVTELTLQFG